MPVLTLIIGGNHEAEDFLYALPEGGWLAENIFYMGRAGSYRVGDVTIAGVFGIHDASIYYQPLNETYPLRTPEDQWSAH